MFKRIIRFFFHLVLALVSLTAWSQKPGCQPKEIGEILFKQSAKPIDTSRTLHSFILPYIAYSPTKGIQIGAGGTISWFVGKSGTTNQSAASVNAEFTSKDQKLYQVKSNVYTDENRWFLQGDWRYYIYSLPTYGLGTGYNEPIPAVDGFPEDSVAVSEWNESFYVRFKWFKVHEIFSYRLTEGLYAGVGFHLDIHRNIEDVALKTDTTVPVITPHYAHSRNHGFDPLEYISSGLSLNLVYDSRDNLISPYKGYFANLNFRTNRKWLGSSQNAAQLWTEFRTYINLEKKFPRHLLAFWYFGGFQLGGSVPYFDLWSTGFDQMNASGRGFLQGRWRGENLVYGEAEYRFPISRCSETLGGVVFINASTASSKDQQVPLFGYIRPGAGVGLRILVAKESRTNIRVDFSVGDRTFGVYFSAQEVF